VMNWLMRRAQQARISQFITSLLALDR